MFHFSGSYYRKMPNLKKEKIKKDDDVGYAI